MNNNFFKCVLLIFGSSVTKSWKTVQMEFRNVVRSYSTTDSRVGTTSCENILRIDSRNTSRTEFQANFECKNPVILRNVFDIDNELWTEQLLERNGEKDVVFDIRNNDGSVESYEASLSDFIGSILDESDHMESWYLLDEDLLKEDSILSRQLTLPDRLFGTDHFNFFPFPLRPHLALIIGGEGARSFLHSDPYEWTGWNYLLEGRKLWIFLPPNVPAVDLDARPHVPDAWDDYNITSGFVSSLDLFKHRVTEMPMKVDENIPVTICDIQLEENEHIKTVSAGVGAGLLLGKLSEQLLSVMSEESEAVTGLSQGHSAGSIPRFYSGAAVDASVDPRLMFGGGALMAEQREGDFVLIPPGWWHQVYHLEPSIAVAGQTISDLGKGRVFRNMLRWCNANSQSLPADFKDLSPQAQVESVIVTCLKARLGDELGESTFRRLTARPRLFKNKNRKP